jgi:hypothetical protein
MMATPFGAAPIGLGEPYAEHAMHQGTAGGGVPG